MKTIRFISVLSMLISVIGISGSAFAEFIPKTSYEISSDSMSVVYSKWTNTTEFSYIEPFPKK